MSLAKSRLREEKAKRKNDKLVLEKVKDLLGTKVAKRESR